MLSLPLGKGRLELDLGGLPLHVLTPRAPTVAQPAGELVRAALSNPTNGPGLTAMARGWRRVTVLVPDVTRKASLPEVLPELLTALFEAGVPPAGVTVLVACGTHPAAPPDALAVLLGTLPKGVGVVQHDARNREALVPAGTLESGLAVRFNRLIMDCDGLVAVSTVQHHYFAGFGGGPKLVFPGASGYKEIQRNHSRVLEFGPPLRRHPGCEPGRLAGNPVAEEIAAAAALRLPDVLLAMVNGDDGRPRWAASGNPADVFAAACQTVRRWFEVEGGPFARMVASAGGHPSDHTLIQAHKALDAACRFLEPGGELLFFADLAGGAGSPAMEVFLADPRPEAILAKLAEDYVQYGHTALRLVEKTGRFRIGLAGSRLEDDLARRLGFEPVGNPGLFLERWYRQDGQTPVGVLSGPPVFPRN